MIRRASASEASMLAGLEGVCFTDAAESPWTEQSIRALLGSPDGAAWVAAPDRRVVGWIAFRRILDEAELLRVAVDPESRRAGVARRLVEHGLDALRADGVATCHLEVRDGNVAALALYASLGFRVVGRRAGYYPGGVDAVLSSVAL